MNADRASALRVSANHPPRCSAGGPPVVDVGGSPAFNCASGLMQVRVILCLLSWRKGGTNVSARCCLAFLFFVSLSAVAQTQHFSGTVSADHAYVRDLGRDLVLFVTTSSIEIHAASAGSVVGNYANCVTPPYHGPNALDLQPWEFASTQNNYPRLERKFQFTLNAADSKAACDELSAALYGPQTMEKDGTILIGKPGYKPPPLGTGVLTISKIELSQPKSGHNASIVSFRFVADITLPYSAGAK